jgi:urease subunit alpha
MARMHEGLAAWPVNVGLQACARSDDAEAGAFEALVEAGAIGFKIHEDYGAYPELIDATLQFAEGRGVAVALHTDGLHEAAELEDTVAAIAGRTVHAYHVEGTGGGHLPDLLGLVREPSVICSSTTPTIPWGPNTAAEHLPMILLNHGGSFGVAGDVAAAQERIHPRTMAAEGPLHELGGIAIVNSDSQGMGRIMETVRRTFQLAHVMRGWAGGTSDDDNDRVLRYLAKVTIEPAIVHGLGAHVGSLEAGRLADIVLWRPAFFGVKPEMVLKGGFQAWGALGEGNATVEGAEPTRYRPDWGGAGRPAAALGVSFSAPGAEGGLGRRLAPMGRRVVEIGRTRGLTRVDLARNRATVPVEIDPADGRVTLDGHELAVEPATDLPLNRRYWLR